MKILVETSARHIHLSRHDFEITQSSLLEKAYLNQVNLPAMNELVLSVLKTKFKVFPY